MTLLLQAQQPKKKRRDEVLNTELGATRLLIHEHLCWEKGGSLSAPADPNEQPHLGGPAPASAQDFYLSSEMELGLFFA